MIAKFCIYGVAKLAQVHVTQKELYNEEGEVLWFDDEHSDNCFYVNKIKIDFSFD